MPLRVAKYGLLAVLLGLIVMFEYWRRSPSNAPTWLYPIAFTLAGVAIWIDIRERRSKEP